MNSAEAVNGVSFEAPCDPTIICSVPKVLHAEETSRGVCHTAGPEKVDPVFGPEHVWRNHAANGRDPISMYPSAESVAGKQGVRGVFDIGSGDFVRHGHPNAGLQIAFAVSTGLEVEPPTAFPVDDLSLIHI